MVTLGEWDGRARSRLLRNATNALVHEAVDVTLQAVVANLPHDVVRVIPWSPVANGPTGAVPQTFWEKVGWAETTLVNVLLKQGELLYRGLVALATILVNVGEAIVDWGMKALGEVKAGDRARSAWAPVRLCSSYVSPSDAL